MTLRPRWSKVCFAPPSLQRAALPPPVRLHAHSPRLWSLPAFCGLAACDDLWKTLGCCIFFINTGQIKIIRTYSQSGKGSDLSFIWTKLHKQNGGGMYGTYCRRCYSGFVPFSPLLWFCCCACHSANALLPSLLSK